MNHFNRFVVELDMKWRKMVVFKKGNWNEQL